MTRLVVLIVALVALSLSGPAAVLAQDATPAAGSPLDGLGLPELRVSVTDARVEVPSQAAAGRYLVALDNPSPYDVEVTFFLPPEGMTMEQVQASPMADETPAWFYEATLAAGVSAEPGSTDQAVLDLAPAGAWVVEVGRYPDEAEGSASPPADFQENTLFPLAVTGEADPGAGAEVPADATIEMRDFDFAIPDRVSAGVQVWEVTNVGQQPHHLVLTRASAPVADAQVEAWLAFEFGMAPEGATPSPDLPNWETFEDVGYVGVLSAGRTAWVAFDLAPGTYAAFCFVSDRETGMPHAAMGMVEVFTVGEPGTPIS